MAERGGPGASLSRIAQRAGMSKAAVLYHVDNRDALISDTVEAVLSRLGERCADALAGAPDPRAAIFAYTEAALGYLWAHPDDLDVITETTHARLVAPGAYAERTAMLEAAITSGVAEGALETSDATVTAIALNGVVDAMAVHGRDSEPDEREALVAEAVNVVDRIITPRT